ncbi:MAG: hypothetical protein D3905_13255 [Candidatus Electrothrix sp. AS4_5]|nr:hypothetical protein [Candidatus Electrothrix gigas]
MTVTKKATVKMTEGVPMNQLEIHQTRALKKQFQAMYRGGKKERAIIERAETLIRRLQANPLDEQAACRRTYNGELRLRDCRKYNLSCGFRLISLKRDNRLIFTYIGSHDDCQKWIENNRDFQDDIESQPIPLIPSCHQGPEAGKEAGDVLSEERDEVDAYEEELMNHLDEYVLREIFSGLCSSL